MATDNFIYQGINRAVSDYSGARACEELINLRPTEGGLVPVRDFSVKMANVPFRKIFVHHTTSGDKYIAIWMDGDAVKVSWVSGTGTVIKDLFNTPFRSGDTIDSIFYASAGNILLISQCDRLNEDFANKAWTWKGDDYVLMDGEAPSVSFTISSEVEVAQANIPGLGQNTSKDEVVSAVENGINAIQEGNLNLCLGPIIIATALKTSDGKTFWTGNWTIYDPIPAINADNRFYLNANSSWFLNQVYRDFGYYAKYDHAYSMAPLTDGGAQGGYEVGVFDTITVPGTKVTLTFPAISGWDEDTSIIQSVEVYASRPQVFIDAAKAADGFFFNGSIAQAALIVPQKKYEDMDLDGQLMYHQASIPLTSLSGMSQDVVLSFGGNVQMTEDTLDTDAGAVKRYGRILSYNARFHFFDSVARIEDIGMPNFLQNASGSRATADVFVRYADNEKEGLYYVGTSSLYKSDSVDNPATNMVISQSLRVKEVILLFSGGVWHTEYYRMQASSAYNYSLCVEGPYQTENAYSQQYVQDLIDAKSNRRVTIEETDAINVTEQYNPFVFLVEHSYKAPGNIIDVLPQMAGIVDASYGRDPLNVFTERGLYALTQGSANVLYGAFLPLSNLKARRGGIPLEMGIFFLADGALWLVAGRQVTLISEALSLGPHKYVRSCLGYKKLSGTDTGFSPTPAPANPIYDVSPYISKVEFREFATGGQLGYNRFRMELFVSNPDYDYTYVVSLKHRQWFKLSRRLWQDDPGSVIINIHGTFGTISVLDMATEVSNSTIPLLVHMQSRPFSMGYQYSHIRRVVSMIRTKLASANNTLAVGLYGSDDLQHWNLLAFAKRSGKTVWNEEREAYEDTPLYVSQVRTAPSARSWRYYTVCIGGEILVDSDFPTDLGPVIIDYEPVVRRIG